MSEEKVLFEDHGNVAVIKINRPDSRNALDSETVLLINKCTEQAKDKKYRAVVLTELAAHFVLVPISENLLIQISWGHGRVCKIRCTMVTMLVL